MNSPYPDTLSFVMVSLPTTFLITNVTGDTALVTTSSLFNLGRNRRSAGPESALCLGSVIHAMPWSPR